MATAAKEKRDTVSEVMTPYVIGFEVKGVRDFLFNAGSVENFDAPAGGGRRLKIELEKDLERKVWRDGTGALALPGHQFVKAIKMASRGMNDVLSPRASLANQIEMYLSEREVFYPFLADSGRPIKTWDYQHDAIVKNGNNSMGPRRRPALNAGWQTEFWLSVTLPEAISPAMVTQLVHRAGLFGVGDGIKIGYGKYVVTRVHDPEDLVWM